MENEILEIYAKRELIKYGAVGGISTLIAYIVKFTSLADYITLLNPTHLSNILLLITVVSMAKYSLVLLDTQLTDYVEVDVESVVEIDNTYGEVITIDNKAYYFDASKDKYKHLQPNQLRMVVTKRCRLPVMLNIK